MFRPICLTLLAVFGSVLLTLVAGCGGPATVQGKATITEPPKTHKTHSPPPVTQPRPATR
jgi:hypothetical protein